MFGMTLAMMVLMIPLLLRATITQDFVSSFDLFFLKRFVALTWKEMMLAALFSIGSSFVLSFVGALAFCIGMYFATVV
jgi:hypothetical protein